ncbi:MAG: AbrB/MazE/SpoVT family DNA-binding domain-containing protein [Desulfotignum sp.]
MENQAHTRNIKLIPIGNSRGVRIPSELLKKYGFSQSLLLIETEQGLLLKKKESDKLSWEDTYKEMAREKEDWSEFDGTLLDGLSDEESDNQAL